MPAFSGFNEARAFCAGNSNESQRQLGRSESFNEARAFCAGNWLVRAMRGLVLRASMRPARFAREIDHHMGANETQAPLQ